MGSSVPAHQGFHAGGNAGVPRLCQDGGGALLLAPFAVRRGALGPLLARWKALVALALVELAVPWFFLFNAEKKITSSLAGLLVAAVPIAGAIIARLTGTDRLDGRRAAGLVLGVAGVGALVGFDVGGSDLLSAASILFVIVGYALGPWILARYLSDLPGPRVITASLALCAVMYAPVAFIQRPQHALSANVLASMAGLTVVCTAVAFVAFFALIGEVGPMRSTVVTYVNPAVAVLLGVTVLGEPFGAATAVGFVLVLAGLVLGHPSLARLLPPPRPCPPPPAVGPAASRRPREPPRGPGEVPPARLLRPGLRPRRPLPAMSYPRLSPPAPLLNPGPPSAPVISRARCVFRALASSRSGGSGPCAFWPWLALLPPHSPGAAPAAWPAHRPLPPRRR